MPEMIVPRHKVLAFYGVPVTSSGTTTITYRRMQHFTELNKNKGSETYDRKYVDEKSKRSDTISYSETINYAFDRYRNNAVHDDIAAISSNELVGDDAKRSIIWVDVDSGEAIKRDYTVSPDSEGNDANTYTCSGVMKASGAPVHGTASSSDDWMTATFTEAS